MKKILLYLIILVVNLLVYGNESGNFQEDTLRISLAHSRENIDFKNKNKYIDKEFVSTDGLTVLFESITKNNLLRTYLNENNLNSRKTVEVGVSFLKRIYGYDSVFFGLGFKDYYDINIDKHYNFYFEEKNELGLLTLWSLDSNLATFNFGFGLYNDFNKGVSLQGEIELRLKIIKSFDLFSLYKIGERKFNGESQIEQILDVGLGFKF